MTKFEELQQAHQHLLDRIDDVTDKAAFVREVQDYVTRVCNEAVDVPAPRDRDQLRANLRYWASYLYDATGTYPNTTMRPARLDNISYASPTPSPAPEPESATPVLRPAAIGLGIMVLLGLVLIGLLVLNRQNESAAIEVMNSAIQATNTAVAALAQMTAQPASTDFFERHGSPPPSTKTPPPTATPSPTRIPAPTQAPLPSVTPLPQTGGGGIAVWTANSTVGPSTSTCNQRSIHVTVPPGALLIELSTIGSGRVVAGARQGAGTTDAFFDLSHRPRAETYLLNVTDLDPQSNQVFASVIIYFTDDCSRNVQTIEYVQAPEELRVTIDFLSYSDPALPLHWYLATWGPAPGFDTWAVQIVFQATGGDGHYIYFADNKALSTEISTAQSQRCQPIYQTVGATSNGVVSSQAVLIMPPFPDCSSP